MTFQMLQDFLAKLGVPDSSKQLILATLVHESYFNFHLDSKRRLRNQTWEGTAEFRKVRLCSHLVPSFALDALSPASLLRQHSC